MIRSLSEVFRFPEVMVRYIVSDMTREIAFIAAKSL